MKKILSLTLVFVMIMSLTTGCFSRTPTAEDLISGAYENISNASSAKMNMLMDVDMVLEDEEMEFSIEMEMDADIELHEDSESSYIETDLKAKIMGVKFEQTQEVYSVVEDDEYVSYSRTIEDDEDSGWIREASDDKSDDMTATFDDLFEDFTNNTDAFSMEDVVNFEEKECYLVRAKVSGMDDFVEHFDVGELVGVDDLDYDDLSVIINLYFNKQSHEIYAIELDLAEGFAKICEDEDFETEVDEFKIVLIYKSFNAVEEIEVPNKVKNSVDDAVIEMPTEPIETEPVTEPVETEPQPTESEDETTPVVNSEISSDWKDMDIKIDGVVYHFPYDYVQLNENGWYINLSDYGYDDGYILNKGDKVSGTIDMYHDKYGEEYNDFSMWVGFKNYGDKAIDILECDLWSIELDIMYGSKPKEDYPEIEIANGITWGATKDEIIAAFGEWDEIYEATDSGYINVDYVCDYDKYMSLTIYDEYGLTCVQFKNYE